MDGRTHGWMCDKMKKHHKLHIKCLRGGYYLTMDGKGQVSVKSNYVSFSPFK